MTHIQNNLDTITQVLAEKIRAQTNEIIILHRGMAAMEAQNKSWGSIVKEGRAENKKFLDEIHALEKELSHYKSDSKPTVNTEMENRNKITVTCKGVGNTRYFTQAAILGGDLSAAFAIPDTHCLAEIKSEDRKPDWAIIITPDQIVDLTKNPRLVIVPKSDHPTHV